MTILAISPNPRPLFAWASAWRMLRKGSRQFQPATRTITAAATGAPNDDEDPTQTKASENYHEYLPLFVP